MSRAKPGAARLLSNLLPTILPKPRTDGHGLQSPALQHAGGVAGKATPARSAWSVTEGRSGTGIRSPSPGSKPSGRTSRPPPSWQRHRQRAGSKGHGPARSRTRPTSVAPVARMGRPACRRWQRWPARADRRASTALPSAWGRRWRRHRSATGSRQLHIPDARDHPFRKFVSTRSD